MTDPLVDVAPVRLYADFGGDTAPSDRAVSGSFSRCLAGIAAVWELELEADNAANVCAIAAYDSEVTPPI
ncbi:MAG: hypothetical protein ABI384_08225 [Allobranchiibius sp.]